MCKHLGDKWDTVIVREKLWYKLGTNIPTNKKNTVPIESAQKPAINPNMSLSHKLCPRIFKANNNIMCVSETKVTTDIPKQINPNPFA